MKVVEDKRICSRCGGKCCKTLPGIVAPSDIELSKITEMLQSGEYCIDWWEGDPRTNRDELGQVYFLRPAMKGAAGKVFDPSWGNDECVFLSKEGTGCKLTYTERPRGCKIIQPKEDHKCSIAGSPKRAGALLWLKHTETLEDAAHKVMEELDQEKKETDIFDSILGMAGMLEGF